MAHFSSLRVWHKAVAMAAFVRLVVSCLPGWERGKLGKQMRDAVDSIVSNIAESSGRSGIRDQLRFLDYALGSARELEAQLEVAGPQTTMALGDAIEEVRTIQRMISGLAKHKRGKLGDE
jgi:four helix bundle protein